MLRYGRFAFPRVKDLNDPFESSVDRNVEILTSKPRLPSHLAMQPVVSPPRGLPLTLSSTYGDGINPNWEENRERFESEVGKYYIKKKQESDRIEKIFLGIDMLRKNIGILSLSDEPENTIMWAHYAENHQGMCVGIDPRNSAISQYRPQAKYDHCAPIFHMRKVTYSSRFPKIKKENIVESATRVFFTKYVEWKYEREYRLIRPISDCKLQNNVPIIEFPTSIIREVIIGARMDNESENLARSINGNWEVRKASIGEDGYLLNIL